MNKDLMKKEVRFLACARNDRIFVGYVILSASEESYIIYIFSLTATIKLGKVNIYSL